MTDPALAGYHGALQAWLNLVPLRQAALTWLCRRGVVAYLVGGTVRDALAGKAGNDMDLAIDSDALAVGRGLADHLHGAFVPLDVERSVSRVVVKTAQGPQHLDLAGLRGKDIQADLHARDLTVNAMAVQVSPRWGALLDPTNGQRDLAQRLLRATGRDAFVDDPARMLRTVRLRAKLGFEVEAATEAMLVHDAARLATVSPERVRDELILILEQDDATAALHYALDHGLYDALLPDAATCTASPDVGLTRLAHLEHWLCALDASGDTHSDLAPPALSRYRQQLQALWTNALSSERSRGSLLKLAVLVSGAAAPDRAAYALGRHLRMSSVEMRYLQAAAGGLAQKGVALNKLDIYRHFRGRGDAGLGAAIVALTSVPDDPLVSMQAEQLLTAWFDQHAALVDPPRLLTGREVMTLGGLEAGPQVGALLEAMREAQVLGDITTREDAVDWLRHAVAAD